MYGISMHIFERLKEFIEKVRLGQEGFLGEEHNDI